MNPSEPDLRTVLRTHLARAIKHRDRLATGALRSVIGAIDNAEAPAAAEPSAGGGVGSGYGGGPIAGAETGLGATEVPRRVLTPQDVIAVVEADIAERRAAAEEVESAGHPERAADLQREADVVEAALRFP